MNRFILLASVLLISISSYASSSEIEDILTRLDDAIENSEVFVNEKNYRINRLRKDFWRFHQRSRMKKHMN